MCRIAGIYFTEESKDNEDWSVNDLAQLLYPAMRSGGPHAFGWMAYDGEQIHYAKFDGDIGRADSLRKVQLPENAKWVVLHTRYATHGDTSNLNNNHPIPHHDVIGVHNGVLQNHEALLDEVGGRFLPDTQVDSEAIFAAVNHIGHRAGLRRIEGDAVAVYSKFSKPQMLWLARTAGRSLTLARTGAGSLVFASTPDILYAAFGHDLNNERVLRRNQLLKVVRGKIVERDFFAPEPTPEPPRPWGTRGSRRNPEPLTSHRGAHTRGVDSYLERRMRERQQSLDNAAAWDADDESRAQLRSGKPLTKKQRERSRRNALARQERDAEAARVRQDSPGGLRWYQGVLVTQDEFDELIKEGMV